MLQSPSPSTYMLVALLPFNLTLFISIYSLYIHNLIASIITQHTTSESLHMSSSPHHHLLLLSLILIPLSLHACTARPLNMGTDPSLVQSQSKPQEGMVVLEVKEATSGQEIIVPSYSHYLDLAKASKTNQGLKRVMLGKATDDSEEMVDESGEKEGMEDVDVMDYAQPHKKPPIHNEKKH